MFGGRHDDTEMLICESFDVSDREEVWYKGYSKDSKVVARSRNDEANSTTKSEALHHFLNPSQNPKVRNK